MASWRIRPRVAVGPLTFGLEKERVVDVLGRDFEPFRRTPDAPEVTLAYRRAGLHVVFNVDDRLDQVVIFEPNEAVLSGVQLLGVRLDVAREMGAREGFEFHPVDAGLWCEEAGVLLIDYEGMVDGVEVHSAASPTGIRH